MDDQPNTDDGVKDSLRVQLTELNNRSRWYATQLWQIPFAYLGLTAVAVASSVDKLQKALPYILFASALFGLCVVRHTAGVTDGIERAVKNLQKTEEALGLPQSAEYKPEGYTEPLRITIILAVIGYTILGVWLLAK